MISSRLLTKTNLVTHGFFNKKNGFSKGIYKSLNCGRSSKDNQKKGAPYIIGFSYNLQFFSALPPKMAFRPRQDPPHIFERLHGYLGLRHQLIICFLRICGKQTPNKKTIRR